MSLESNPVKLQQHYDNTKNTSTKSLIAVYCTRVKNLFEILVKPNQFFGLLAIYMIVACLSQKCTIVISCNYIFNCVIRVKLNISTFLNDRKMASEIDVIDLTYY
jgi:hypothetical protein